MMTSKDPSSYAYVGHADVALRSDVEEVISDVHNLKENLEDQLNEVIEYSIHEISSRIDDIPKFCMITLHFGRWSTKAGYLFVHERVYTNTGRWTPICLTHFRHVGSVPCSYILNSAEKVGESDAR